MKKIVKVSIYCLLMVISFSTCHGQSLERELTGFFRSLYYDVKDILKSNSDRMIYAIENNDLGEFNKALRRSADVNDMSWGVTPLMAVALMKPKLNWFFIEGLMHKNADVNLAATYEKSPGWTALMFAARGGNDYAVQRLLGAHAHVNALNAAGFTALDMAEEKLKDLITEQQKEKKNEQEAHEKNDALKEEEHRKRHEAYAADRDSYEKIVKKLKSAGAKRKNELLADK